MLMHPRSLLTYLFVGFLFLIAADVCAAPIGPTATISDRLITWQGQVEKAGQPVDNEPVLVQFQAFDALTGGAALAAPLQVQVPSAQVKDGVFTAQVNATTLGLPNSLAQTFLEISVCAPDPCTLQLLAPRLELTYAAKAVSASSLAGRAEPEELGAVMFRFSGAAEGGVIKMESELTPGVTQEMRLDADAGAIVTRRADGTATASLEAEASSGERTIAKLDAVGRTFEIAIQEPVVNAAGINVFPKFAVILSQPGTVGMAAFDGVNAATLRLQTGDIAAMELDPVIGEARILMTGGLRSNSVKIGGLTASRAAGPGSSAELVVNANGDLELKVDGVNVDRWTGLGDTGTVFGFSPNRISGSPQNVVAADKFGAVISGGGSPGNFHIVSESFGTIGGGLQNTASHFYATVGGGRRNTASGERSTVGGGLLNTASDTNGVNGASTVAGGHNNTASNGYDTVGGGHNNTASGGLATVPGGSNNMASGNISFAAGSGCVASGASSFALGTSSVASALRSFAMGVFAEAHFRGMIVLADSTFDVFPALTELNFTPRTDQFLVRAKGGVVFVTGVDGSGNSTAGVQLASGGGSWSSLSDRNAKENLAPVNRREALEKVAAMPISTWNYKSQDPSIRHIGPMAQDLHAAFRVGEKETMITAIDADGVALAAIQGLYEIVQDKHCEIDELREEKDREIEDLRSEISNLKEILQSLVVQDGGGR